ncbi:hypothetical protein GCM10027072_35140 [Streptomyces bullii]
MLRTLAAAGAATALVGAAVMRRWDIQAGKQVADLTRARASDEWRFEERVAELEADLEESRELRVKLEQRLRAKRAELAGLRNEHAALLRRYATAEADRASVLEERRVLEIEAAAPARALTAGPATAGPEATGPQTARPQTAAGAGSTHAEASGDEASGAETAGVDAAPEGGSEPEAVEEKPAVPAVFSPEGSQLFLRAKAALARFDGDTPDRDTRDSDTSDGVAPDGGGTDGVAPDGDGTDGVAPDGDGTDGDGTAKTDATDKDGDTPDGDTPDGDGAPKGDGTPEDDDAPQGDGVPHGDAAGSTTEQSQREPADEPQGPSEAAEGPEHATAATSTAARHDQPGQQPSGHFTVPTAVAVVPPTAPVRRPVTEGGFDFFGTKKGTSPAALEAVQNEDLADVVGQEALALHKAETEAQFKPAGAESRAVGQVIDLTAHDETEQIDVQGLRSAAS